MKELTVTNHSIVRYASRTGRNSDLVSNLIKSIRSGKKLSLSEVIKRGFSITRYSKDDSFYLWFDDIAQDELLAIVTIDGFIKTVLRREMFGYINYGCKMRYEFSNHLIT